MGKTIMVTPEMLESVAKEIEGLASDYKAQYEALYRETDSMVSTWQGKDNVAYTERIAGFKDDFGTMYELMNKYADFLRASAESYRRTQDNVVQNAQKLIN